MTTVKAIYAENIYLKGKPIQSGSTNDFNIDTNITNNITTINAVISGLTGGQPIPDVLPDPKLKSRPPTNFDDITENWNLNSIWTTSDKTSYVRVNNNESNAVWEIITLKIDDNTPTNNNVYSSSKYSQN